MLTLLCTLVEGPFRPDGTVITLLSFTDVKEDVLGELPAAEEQKTSSAPSL
jgi:hypothetical protein